MCRAEHLLRGRIYTSKVGKDILIFHNSRASMDCDIHSEQPNVGSLRTYRSQLDLTYSYNRATYAHRVGHVSLGVKPDAVVGTPN